MRELQDKLGYVFKDISLLEHALIHSSYANERQLGHNGSNERLEFLGDAVLELVSSEYLYSAFPDKPEGEMTKIRAAAVCEPALAACAEQIGLSRYILLGRGENSTGGRKRPSIISDALEAVIGAVYIDGGYESAKELVMRHILNDVEDKRFFYDGKTALQEYTQKLYGCSPVYEITGESGPDHDKSYTVEVTVDGKLLGTGTASSKKRAAQSAAYEALRSLHRVN